MKILKLFIQNLKVSNLIKQNYFAIILKGILDTIRLGDIWKLNLLKKKPKKLEEK